MRHFKKRVLALLLAGAVGIGNYASVSASAIKDAQDKKDEAQQELNQVNQQIQNIQSAQNSLQAEMNNYDNQLMSLLTDMDPAERYGYAGAGDRTGKRGSGKCESGGTAAV